MEKSAVTVSLVAMNSHIVRPLLKTATTTCVLALSLSLAACGGPPNPTPSEHKASTSSKTNAQLIGVTDESKPGEKPKLNFKTPFTVTDKSSAILQEGDGDAVQDNDRLCVRNVIVSAKDGKELQSTWNDERPDCQIVVNRKTYPAYYDDFIKMKVNGTMAVGINDKSSKDSEMSSYISALTIVSKSKPIKRAQGTKVTDVPSDLPKVTLDSTGKPSIDLNGYKPNGKLVVQPLIKGSGIPVQPDGSVSAHYTGWLASNGKQFDSSWDRGEPSDFKLDGVIKGWKEGLAGQSVGSQVLLIVPSDLGYGDDAQKGIPAKSTLIFVVDILATY
ncbi:peptidylprolyl isomerase [Bombiscardovia nodaiensis]|uniref:peptidylprolyl isomerase n=1 Tax=Bombiscardovia nodaiensis TaxID=2932181 RepID=A0ABM8B9U0_9BIFI|nr:peptidylprolyl isomerase [Bombiscardovia nodaiensis]